MRYLRLVWSWFRLENTVSAAWVLDQRRREGGQGADPYVIDWTKMRERER